MTTREENREYGLRTEGHEATSVVEGPVVLGEGDFRYEVSGSNWGNLPEGWIYKEATAVAVDSRDNIYVFNRGTCPMIVFDREGNIVRTWGDGVFKNPHGVTIAPDDTVFCVDNGDGTVRKFTPEGKLLMTLGTPNQPTPKMSGKPFSVPAHRRVLRGRWLLECPRSQVHPGWQTPVFVGRIWNRRGTVQHRP